MRFEKPKIATKTGIFLVAASSNIDDSNGLAQQKERIVDANQPKNDVSIPVSLASNDEVIFVDSNVEYIPNLDDTNLVNSNKSENLPHSSHRGTYIIEVRYEIRPGKNINGKY